MRRSLQRTEPLCIQTANEEQNLQLLTLFFYTSEIDLYFYTLNILFHLLFVVSLQMEKVAFDQSNVPVFPHMLSQYVLGRVLETLF